MKKVLLVFFVLLNLAAYAQEGNRNSFGVMAGLGSASVQRASLEGGPSFDLQNNFELGVNYYRQIGGRLKIETGIVYHYNQLIQGRESTPDAPQVTTQYDIHLLYLPAFLRVNLSEHFFISGGALVDIDMSNNLNLPSSRALSSQSGLGFGLGVGGEVLMFRALYLQLNPYLNLHAALPVNEESHPGRIMDTGIRVGIRTK